MAPLYFHIFKMLRSCLKKNLEVLNQLSIALFQKEIKLQ